MPEICRFYGIKIKIYFDDHEPPHFHVEYEEHRAVFSINNLQILEGYLPRRVVSLVLEWSFQKRQELIDNWELARSKKPLIKIEPLE